MKNKIILSFLKNFIKEIKNETAFFNVKSEDILHKNDVTEDMEISEYIKNQNSYDSDYTDEDIEILVSLSDNKESTKKNIITKSLVDSDKFQYDLIEKKYGISSRISNK